MSKEPQVVHEPLFGHSWYNANEFFLQLPAKVVFLTGVIRTCPDISFIEPLQTGLLTDFFMTRGYCECFFFPFQEASPPHHEKALEVLKAQQCSPSSAILPA